MFDDLEMDYNALVVALIMWLVIGYAFIRFGHEAYGWVGVIIGTIVMLPIFYFVVKHVAEK